MDGARGRGHNILRPRIRYALDRIVLRSLCNDLSGFSRNDATLFHRNNIYIQGSDRTALPNSVSHTLFGHKGFYSI